MATSSTHMVQTEQVQPAYSVVAAQIINIVTQLEGNDQETIRMALNVFARASDPSNMPVAETRRY